MLKSRILVPIGFSPQSGPALRYVHSISNYLGMNLTLLHCYPIKEYSRPYNFGKKDYDVGCKELLIKIYKEHVNEQVNHTRFLVHPGSVTEIVSTISHRYDLVFLSDKMFGSHLKRWMGSRSSFIASMAKCPVLILPITSNILEYSEWKKVWHINRKDNEVDIIRKHLPNLKINPSVIEVKSFKQSSFKSTIWKSIVSYVKTPKEDIRQAILDEIKSEAIDMIMLVSHEKNSFQKFVNDDAMQIIFQFNIPVLIFQANTFK